MKNNYEAQDKKKSLEGYLDRSIRNWRESLYSKESAEFLYKGFKAIKFLNALGFVTSIMTSDTDGAIYSIGGYLIVGDMAKHFEDYV